MVRQVIQIDEAAVKENTEMLLPTIKKIDEISEDRYGL